MDTKFRIEVWLLESLDFNCNDKTLERAQSKVFEKPPNFEWAGMNLYWGMDHDPWIIMWPPSKKQHVSSSVWYSTFVNDGLNTCVFPLLNVPLIGGWGRLTLPFTLRKHRDTIETLYSVFQWRKLWHTKKTPMQDIQHFLLFLFGIWLLIIQNMQALFKKRLHVEKIKMA